MIDKTFLKLRILYFSTIVLLIIAFVIDVLYTTKYTTYTENVGLERWSIIITLGGVYLSLKLLHTKVKDTDKTDKIIAIKKYQTKYILRHCALTGLCLFNIICFHITAAKNFTFLVIIVIFAMFLCIPNKKNLEEETINPE